MTDGPEEVRELAEFAQRVARAGGFTSSLRMEPEGFQLLVTSGDSARAIIDIAVCGNDSFEIHFPNDISFHETAYDPTGYREAIDNLYQILLAVESGTTFRHVRRRVLFWHVDVVVPDDPQVPEGWPSDTRFTNRVQTLKASG
jgi:hypothetical protein